MTPSHLRKTLKTVFAINREIVNTAIGRDVSTALAESAIPVLGSHISQRVAFAESIAQGQTVFESLSDRKAIQEIEAVGEELLAHLGIATPTQDRRSA